MSIQILALLIDIPSCYTFVYGFGPIERFSDALVGTALAWMLASFVTFIITVIIVLYFSEERIRRSQSYSVINSSDCSKETDTGDIREESIFNWISQQGRLIVYLEQALPNLVGAFFTSLSFLFLSVLAAKLGNIELAVNNLSWAIFELANTISSGSAEATSIRVGYHVGNADPVSAIKVVNLALLVSVSWGLTLASAGYLYRNELAHLLNSNPDISQSLIQVSPFLWLGYAASCVSSQICGILDGQGRAEETQKIGFFGTFLTTCPLAAISFFFTDYGLRGLWGSFALGELLSVLCGFYFLSSTNWDEIIAAASLKI
jgi:MATE family multidrug resistance protein